MKENAIPAGGRGSSREHHSVRHRAATYPQARQVLERIGFLLSKALYVFCISIVIEYVERLRLAYCRLRSDPSWLSLGFCGFHKRPERSRHHYLHIAR